MEKDENWKLINSLWAILTVFGVFNWIIFLYIGSNSKCRKYTIIGILYSVISFISIFASVLKLVPLSNFVMSFCLIGYPIGIIYSFFNCLIPQFFTEEHLKFFIFHPDTYSLSIMILWTNLSRAIASSIWFIICSSSGVILIHIWRKALSFCFLYFLILSPPKAHCSMALL